MNRIPSICATLILAGWALPATAQVWVDATQLGDRIPDWVDSKYYRPTPPPTVITRIGVDPVYRIVVKRIWHEPVYQTICQRVWVEGHYEMLPPPEPCDEPLIQYKNLAPKAPLQRVWVPGHYITIERQVCIRPGYWETRQVKELVSPGYWEPVECRTIEQDVR